MDRDKLAKIIGDFVLQILAAEQEIESLKKQLAECRGQNNQG
jgi:hypothetical protein